MGGCCDVKSSGGIATVLAACLLSIGWALNVAALSTCRLVATDGFRDTENDNGLVTGLGLYTFEGSNEWGQSYCYIFEYTTLTTNFSYWVDTRMNAPELQAELPRSWPFAAWFLAGAVSAAVVSPSGRFGLLWESFHSYRRFY